MQEIIKRINELSKKSKTEGLNETEKTEQKELRQKYLQNFRKNFKNQLDSIKVVDPENLEEEKVVN